MSYTRGEKERRIMEKSGILKNKLFLYLTEFFAGMSVMAVELGASRLLAPYFSSSQIVWTIIIGTIMIAMALGNIYGGKSADRSPDPDKLYRRILIAAIWIALIPVVGKYIILGISALLIFTVIVVDEVQRTHAAAGQCLNGIAAHAANAEHCHAGMVQRFHGFLAQQQLGAGILILHIDTLHFSGPATPARRSRFSVVLHHALPPGSGSLFHLYDGAAA